jgi:hypothetical protein
MKIRPAALLALPLLGCSPGDEPAAASVAAAPAASQADSPSDTKADSQADAAPREGFVAGRARSMTFEVPESWRSETPSSGMRLAQYAVADDTELVLFHFGEGGGGSAQANLDRWVGQVSQPDGSPSSNRAMYTRAERDGLSFSMVDVAGTYQGMGASAQEGWRLLGAVVEGGDGPYFLRLTGPEATVESALQDYLQVVASIRVDA